MLAATLLHRLSRGIAGYGVAVATTLAATGAIEALDHFIRIPNASLLYLPAILISAVSFGTGPSLAAATLAVLQYDFFLLEPIHTLTIGRAEDILAFAVFLIVALITSQLAGRARQRAEAAQRRAREGGTLYELGQALMSTHDVEELLHAVTERVVEVFRVDRSAIFVPDAGGALELAAETVRGGRRDRASQATAAWAFQQGTEIGLPGARDSQRTFVPLRTAERVVGVLEVGRKRSGEALDLEERRLLTSFAAQAALVVSRAQSDEERLRLQIVDESDRLKSALLNAVSHDLRTPLSSIKASVTALLLADTSWSSEEGREFLHAIDHEANRLNRLVGNLLDLSRIEAGVLRPVLEWYDVQEVVATALPRLRSLLGDRPFLADIQPDLPPVQVDLLRIEELLINLVENAVKYTPPGSPIELHVRREEDGLALAVVDHGPGIPERQRTRVFETFYQGRGQDDRQPGTGLGLAICRGVAHAHGGTISIEPTRGGGASFVLHLPATLLGERVPA